jgi:hypothetical protein
MQDIMAGTMQKSLIEILQGKIHREIQFYGAGTQLCVYTRGGTVWGKSENNLQIRDVSISIMTTNNHPYSIREVEVIDHTNTACPVRLMQRLSSDVPLDVSVILNEQLEQSVADPHIWSAHGRGYGGAMLEILKVNDGTTYFAHLIFQNQKQMSGFDFDGLINAMAAPVLEELYP